MLENWQNLANAVILQAVRDYRVALVRRHHFPYDRDNIRELRKLERFFRGQDINLYNDQIDGPGLMRMIKKEVEDDNYRLKPDRDYDLVS